MCEPLHPVGTKSEERAEPRPSLSGRQPGAMASGRRCGGGGGLQPQGSGSQASDGSREPGPDTPEAGRVMSGWEQLLLPITLRQEAPQARNGFGEA